MAQDIVPIVRQWLRGGIKETHLRQSTRIVEAESLDGGLKSAAVMDLAVGIRCVIKQGSEELKLHEQLMNGINNVNRTLNKRKYKLQDAVFPEVVLTQQMGESDDYLMLMQSLVGYQSLQKTLFEKYDAQGIASQAVERSLPLLKVLHSLPRDRLISLSGLKCHRNPFGKRIRTILNKVRDVDAELSSMWTHSGRSNDVSVPGLDDLLGKLDRWLNKRQSEIEPHLVHGDCHFGNLMVKRKGKSLSVRWIDPNPTVGFSDIAYDWGKLFHFAEPIGWAMHKPNLCNASFYFHEDRWILKTSSPGSGTACERQAENSRRNIEGILKKAALSALGSGEAPILQVAIASAHLGLVNLHTKTSDDHASDANARRFALAHAVAALGRWYEMIV